MYWSRVNKVRIAGQPARNPSLTSVVVVEVIVVASEVVSSSSSSRKLNVVHDGCDNQLSGPNVASYLSRSF